MKNTLLNRNRRQGSVDLQMLFSKQNGTRTFENMLRVGKHAAKEQENRRQKPSKAQNVLQQTKKRRLRDQGLTNFSYQNDLDRLMFQYDSPPEKEGFKGDSSNLYPLHGE